MQMTLETIHPDQAKKLLASHSNYRGLRSSHVVKLSTALKRGDWKETGEAIKINKKGTLIDGQHRLAACVEADTPITTWVARGVEDDAVEAMDDSLPRSTADVLGARNVPNAKAMVATANKVAFWSERGGFANSHVMLRSSTRVQTIQFVENNEKELAEACVMGRKFTVGDAKALRVKSSMISAFAYLSAKVDPVDCESFLNSLKSGEGLLKGNPVLALRNWLINKAAANVRPTDEELAFALSKSWNAFRQGGEISNIKLPVLKGKKGANRPELPELV